MKSHYAVLLGSVYDQYKDQEIRELVEPIKQYILSPERLWQEQYVTNKEKPLFSESEFKRYIKGALYGIKWPKPTFRFPVAMAFIQAVNDLHGLIFQLDGYKQCKLRNLDKTIPENEQWKSQLYMFATKLESQHMILLIQELEANGRHVNALIHDAIEINGIIDQSFMGNILNRLYARGFYDTVGIQVKSKSESIHALKHEIQSLYNEYTPIEYDQINLSEISGDMNEQDGDNENELSVDAGKLIRNVTMESVYLLPCVLSEFKKMEAEQGTDLHSLCKILTTPVVFFYKRPDGQFSEPQSESQIIQVCRDMMIVYYDNPCGKKKTRHRIIDLWLDYPHKAYTYYGYGWFPNPSLVPRNYLNTFTGLAVEQIVLSTQDRQNPQYLELFEFFKWLLLYILDTESGHYDYWFTWIRNLFRNPGSKSLVNMWLFSDIRGNGKSTIQTVIRKMIGQDYSWEAPGDQLFDKFNKLLDKCLLIVLDDNSRLTRDECDKLKKHTTQEELSKRCMFTDSQKTVDYTQYWIIANNANMFVEKNDRRNMVSSTSAAPFGPDDPRKIMCKNLKNTPPVWRLIYEWFMLPEHAVDPEFDFAGNRPFSSTYEKMKNSSMGSFLRVYRDWILGYALNSSCRTAERLNSNQNRSFYQDENDQSIMDQLAKIPDIDSSMNAYESHYLGILQLNPRQFYSTNPSLDTGEIFPDEEIGIPIKQLYQKSYLKLTSGNGVGNGSADKESRITVDQRYFEEHLAEELDHLDLSGKARTLKQRTDYNRAGVCYGKGYARHGVHDTDEGSSKFGYKNKNVWMFHLPTALKWLYIHGHIAKSDLLPFYG
jgi:hypothetical protein